MKSLFTLSLAFAIVACLTVTTSFAQEGSDSKASPKAMAAELDSSAAKDGSSCKSSGSCCKGECPISAAMASLPKMSYKVGDESTCCSHSAEALAEKHSAPIHFVVAETSYTDKSEAMTALVEKTEAMLTALQRQVFVKNLAKLRSPANHSLAQKVLPVAPRWYKRLLIQSTFLTLLAKKLAAAQ